ncbi:hypothetical protein R3I93_022818 [Phoxinus phoxinus]|uniref:Uncharacterized protein n=1 Tax=Phoxinus phoxinus TaxID=58324 RepID=A0AAN9C518_9TELE
MLQSLRQHENRCLTVNLHLSVHRLPRNRPEMMRHQQGVSVEHFWRLYSPREPQKSPHHCRSLAGLEWTQRANWTGTDVLCLPGPSTLIIRALWSSRWGFVRSLRVIT